MKQKLLVSIVIVAALVLGVYASISVAPQQAPKYAQLYPVPKTLSQFELVNQHGAAFGTEQLLGHWTLAFTGYTFCPDICPATLAQLKKVYPELIELSPDIPLQILFVSVDPARDSVPRLLEYTTFFHSEFLAVTAEHKHLFPFVREMGLMYSMPESTDNDSYLVSHSGSIVIIDPQARVVGRFKPKMEPGKIALVENAHLIHDMPIITGS